MTQHPPAAGTALPAWEHEIRALEDQARIAFLDSDIDFLNRLWVDSYTVNSPLDRIHQKAQVLDLLKAGRIRHATYDCEIEQVSRYGDTVVVMGNDRVNGPPEGVVARRRYTNIWQLVDGRWRGIARHAHVVARENAS